MKNKTRKGPAPQIEKDKEVMKLRFQDGLSFRDIAKETKQDVSMVYYRYKRALRGYPQAKFDTVVK